MDFIDTATIIAAFFKDEKHHESGKQVFDDIVSGKIRNPVITDYIIDEAVTFARKRKGTEISIEILDVLLALSPFKIIKINEKYFEAAVQLFREYENISFTDATTIAVMMDLGIKKIYSFDSDFDSIPDVTRLEKPQN